MAFHASDYSWLDRAIPLSRRARRRARRNPPRRPGGRSLPLARGSREPGNARLGGRRERADADRRSTAPSATRWSASSPSSSTTRGRRRCSSGAGATSSLHNPGLLNQPRLYVQDGVRAGARPARSERAQRRGHDRADRDRAVAGRRAWWLTPVRGWQRSPGDPRARRGRRDRSPGCAAAREVRQHRVGAGRHRVLLPALPGARQRAAGGRAVLRAHLLPPSRRSAAGGRAGVRDTRCEGSRADGPRDRGRPLGRDHRPARRQRRQRDLPRSIARPLARRGRSSPASTRPTISSRAPMAVCSSARPGTRRCGRIVSVDPDAAGFDVREVVAGIRRPPVERGHGARTRSSPHTFSNASDHLAALRPGRLAAGRDSAAGDRIDRRDRCGAGRRRGPLRVHVVHAAADGAVRSA